MNRIYCISGMGADERIFSKLDIPGHELIPVKWVPFDKEDTLVSYAQRLALQITEPDAILLGLSFGGMLAVEIGKITSARKIFLISSAKESRQLPWIGRISISKKLLEFVPEQLFTRSGDYGFRIFAGAKSADDRHLLSAMMKDSLPGFVKNALKLVLRWNNTSYPGNVIQLHGTSDMIIPARNIKADHWIKGGSHIMVYNRAEEVSKIISDALIIG